MKAVCPLDGGATHAEASLPGFLVCDTCAEILAPAETVWRATRRTKRRYLRKKV